MDETNTKYEGISGPAIVERIDSILQHNYKTRQQLAEACGFSTANIARWKTLGSLPDLKVGAKVADFLGVPLYWLITGQDEESDVESEDFLLLNSFHVLDENDREVVLATIKALSKKYVKKGFEGRTVVD